MGQLWAALSFSDISIICSFFGNYLRSRIRQARMASRRTASKRPEAQIATKHSLMQRSLLPASRLLANLDQKYMAAPEENIPQKMRDETGVGGFSGSGAGGFSGKVVVPPSFGWNMICERAGSYMRRLAPLPCCLGRRWRLAMQGQADEGSSCGLGLMRILF